MSLKDLYFTDKEHPAELLAYEDTNFECPRPGYIGLFFINNVNQIKQNSVSSPIDILKF